MMNRWYQCNNPDQSLMFCSAAMRIYNSDQLENFTHRCIFVLGVWYLLLASL